MIKAYAEAYNQIVHNILSCNPNHCQIRNHSKRHKRSSRELLDFILKLSSEKQNQLQDKYSFKLINEIFTKFPIRSDDTFIHLGCAYGHVPLQIAGMMACKKSIGIETNPDVYRLAKVNFIQIEDSEIILLFHCPSSLNKNFLSG